MSVSVSKPLQAVLIGAGQRGRDVYGAYAVAHPDVIRFVAVAEPNAERRALFADQHNISPENLFESWEPLLEGPLLGQAALVCTQDQAHTESTLAALRTGYDVLLEKPMTTTAAACRQLVDIAEETGRQLHICHVLRFTTHFSKMRAIIRSGQLGQIVSVSHRENVSWWHMAHSFVRGNWRRRDQSAPMILAKCCHDLDILVWMLDDHCDTLSSVGNLRHYRPENAPEGAPDHCLAGCPVEETCPYYTPFLYVDLIPLWRSAAATDRGLSKALLQANLRAPGLIKALSRVVPPLRQLSDYRDWPRSVLADDPTPENVLAALRDGPYGRCVYRCDNDVVDHQVVSMQFEGGPSVTLTMHGHANVEGRFTRIQGSRAELQATFGLGGSWIDVREHRSGREIHIDTSAGPGAGHGGGDEGLMAAFIESVQQGDDAAALSTARQSLESHLMAFAAEQARLGGEVVSMQSMR